MTFALEFTEKSRIDIKETAGWYNEQREGLGDEFMLSLESMINLLQRNPYIFQKRIENIRFGLLRRFPYIVAYIAEENDHKIVVLGVVSTRRNPDSLLK